MINKEFEDKKQALRELVYATDNKRKNLVPTANMRIKLSKAINELQPPKPPTCSTCKYYLDSDSSCDNWDVVGDPSHDGFGCIEHSDYGDAK